MSRTILKLILGAAFAAGAGCGSRSTEETHLANLPAPSEEEIAKANAKAKTIAMPKVRFGSSSMPRSEMTKTPTTP